MCLALAGMPCVDLVRAALVSLRPGPIDRPRFVAAVDNLADGSSPREQLDSMWPREKYRVIEKDEHVVLDPNKLKLKPFKDGAWPE